jgi:hypothetical protein
MSAGVGDHFDRWYEDSRELFVTKNGWAACYSLRPGKLTVLGAAFGLNQESAWDLLLADMNAGGICYELLRTYTGQDMRFPRSKGRDAQIRWLKRKGVSVRRATLRLDQ